MELRESEASAVPLVWLSIVGGVNAANMLRAAVHDPSQEKAVQQREWISKQ